jgi:DNA (cytosine-5)-methyltransferase 1
MLGVSLFAGCGGAALGLRRAGIRHLACVEQAPAAAATLAAAGFPVVESEVGEWLNGTDIEPGSLDLLDGGPPCQPYSTAGKGLGVDDPRDGWPVMLRAVEQLRPRWVIVENVPPSPYRAWRLELLALGYPWVEYRVLDAADYGIPQTRERVFIVAGPRPIRWPERTHGDPRRPEATPAQLSVVPTLRSWVSCRDAIGCPDGGEAGPSPTISTVASSGMGGSGGRSLLMRQIGRDKLTVPECMTLQALPADYPLQGNVTEQYRQVGNAIPPLMFELLGQAVRVADDQQ